MRRRLAEDASGLRHLRHAREVLGSLDAHLAQDDLLAQIDREELGREGSALGARVDALSAAVKDHRDFLERVRTKARGGLRVAAWIEATTNAPSRQDKDALEIATRLRADFDALEDRETAPRRAAVRARVAELRATLDAMDARLEQRFGVDFVDSLYPAVSADGARVVDAGLDDDASQPS